jgi:uncharacterized membrane protein
MSRTRLSCGITFVIAGILHFLRPDVYETIMPPYLPDHHELVLASGAAESLGGLMILIPGLERPARWWMIATLIAIFPANLHMALHPDEIRGMPEIPRALLWLRLPGQLLFIWWVVRATNKRAPEPALAA